MNRARIIVLIIAVAAAGIAVKLMRSINVPPPAQVIVQEAPKIETDQVLVATAPIAAGQKLSGQNIGWHEWPASAAAQFIMKSKRPNALTEFTGGRARSAFAAGEPIRETRLVKGTGFLAAVLAKGMRAFSTEVSPESDVGGFVLPGDRVDVILTRTPPSAAVEEGSSSEMILRNVRVLAIDHNTDEPSQNTVAGKIATLEVTPSQAETLALARRIGTISLALRSLDDGEGLPEDASDLRRQGISVVRYGIHTSAPK
jgi:pilus assembly protein CpaB